tara:strand:+ start:8309 stop:8581 length:273 start_codon:yes stop_codon:yes gene_type:complete
MRMSYSSSGGPEDRNKSTNERPIDEVRFGRCKVVVWANKTQNGDMLNFVPTRLYKDGEEWKESPSLGVAELLPMAEALCEAFRRATSPKE